MNNNSIESLLDEYRNRLLCAVNSIPVPPVKALSEALLFAWKNDRKVFIFGNGGSAGNAIHLANDYLYGISRQFGNALKVQALSSNQAVITCLANDEGYDHIYDQQLAVYAEPGDIAIAFSGSGNSANIVKALEYCRDNKIISFAVLGFDGGKAKSLASHVIHIPINDMQISEDLQLIIGHVLMQWLYLHKDTIK